MKKCDKIMFLYVLIFVLFFFLFFIISYFCIFKRKLIIDNLYLIIPSICIGLWALYALIYCDFTPIKSDFYVFYSSGKQIFLNPSKLYNVSGYYYMPSFAVLFAISLSLLPLDTAYSTFFIINYILGVLTIRDFNKILIFMNVKEKIHRFMFLIIISNGYFVFHQFYFNQSKYLTFLIFLFIIRRELQYKKEENKKDLKYYLLNYGLFVFAIAMSPYFIFFLLIYIFQDIPKNELFKIENVKKYSIAISMFLIQNILFIIFPQLLFEFIDGFYRPTRKPEYLKLLYLREWVKLSASYIRILSILFSIILSIITIILIFNNKLNIEVKFGYFAIAYIFIGIFSYDFLLGLILYPLVILLFVPYLNENYSSFEFFKSNRILLLGLASILGIFFAWSTFIIFDFIPGLQDFPLIIFFYLRWIFLLSIMMISLIFLKFKKNKINLRNNYE